MQMFRVLFSFLTPREGYIPVEAKNEEEAKQMVEDLMGDNYVNFTVVQITPIDSIKEIQKMVDAQQQTELPIGIPDRKDMN